jgi:hypothetical protein
MDTMIILLIIVVGVLVITNTMYIWRSNQSIRKLIILHEKNKINDQFILGHIVHTHTSLNVVYTSIAIVTFIFAFLGVNAYTHLEREMHTSLQEKSDAIYKSILETNVDSLLEMKNNIIQISTDAKNQKKKFDTIVSKRMIDSLDTQLSNPARRIGWYEVSTRRNQAKNENLMWLEINNLKDQIAKLENAHTKSGN